ncbi:hypothetical protein EST38_g11546 [Candolleomyces aberdarensis]|uniref:GH16 domain-containing protein n=1 Tax=Candolleomyces aberdarensis TaxID=2316362 RepID=A0A4Q2D6V5_9AGAR|nr:hypothetical protein EST38_g11546 [Candolleomyces aberdarensis]
MLPRSFHSGLLTHLILLATASVVSAQHYRIKDVFIGQDFFNSWTWETFQDPTHGRVNYVDQATAISKNLSYVVDNQFVMRADSSSVVNVNSRGRDSIRIKSNAAYDAALMVLDLAHMPEGCATWPAWWTLSAKGPWPVGGEIDIIEGVNLNSNNAATLHTSSACSMADSRNQKGTATSTDCDVAANSNQGCGTKFSRDNSYGSKFNRRNGGWYVVQRDAAAGIKVWFWPRDDPSLPQSIRYGSSDIDIGPEWGMPEASFTFENCDYGGHFDAHQVMFDLTFCVRPAYST